MAINGVGAVAKSLDHQRIKAELGQRRTGARVVAGAAGEAVAADAIGQGRQQPALSESLRPVVQVVRKEAVAADIHTPEAAR